MSFLYLKDGVVTVTEDGMTIPVVNDLLKYDKHSPKKFFLDTLTYCYYVYKNEGQYTNKLPQERKKFVIDNHLPDRKVSDFEGNIRAKAIIDIYFELELTPIQKLYEALRRDVEGLLKRLADIPYEREVKVSFDAEVMVGEEKVTRTFTQMVMMDNSREKEKAMELALKLMEYENRLKEKIVKENKEKKRDGISLFDKSEKS